MGISANKACERWATVLIDGGHYDTDSAWSFSSTDGDTLLGPNGDDWDNYAKFHLGIDADAAEKTKERFKYPVGKGGKIYKRALDAIDSRATQNDDVDVDAAAKRLKEALAKKTDGGKQSMTVDLNARLGDNDMAQIRAQVAEAVRLGYADAGIIQAPIPLGNGVERRSLLARMQPDSWDDNDNSVDCVFSAGTAVRRYDWSTGRDYDETLQIDKKSIRLDRLNAGAPLIDSHNYWGGVGARLGATVPGTVRIENGQLCGRVAFSMATPETQAVAQDVKAGLLRSLSLGYVTHKQTIDDTKSPAEYRATDWEPYEVSVVLLPADPVAGFRSLQRPTAAHTERTDMDPKEAAAAEAARTQTAVDTAVEKTQKDTREATLKSERERSAGIKDTAKRLGLPDALAEKHIADGTELASFRDLAIGEREKADKLTRDGIGGVVDVANPSGSGAPDVYDVAVRARTPEKGEGMGRLVRAMAATKCNQRDAIQVLTQWAKADRSRGRPCIEHERDIKMMERALIASGFSAGGALVQEQYYDEIIELLRPAAVVRSLNPIVLPMPGGNLNWPKLTGGATAAYSGEATDATSSQETTGDLRLSAKKLIALVPVSNSLLRFSSPQADVVVRDDIVRQVAVAEDQAFLRGAGTDFTPKGMRNWVKSAEITHSAGTGLANVNTDFTALVTSLMSANVGMSRPGVIMSPRTRNALYSLQTTTGAYVYRDEMNQGKFWGYPFRMTTSMPINLGNGSQAEVYIADFADVVIGEVPGMTIAASEEAAYLDASSGTLVSAFSRDLTLVRLIEEHDFGMRHDESIAVLDQVAY